MEYDLSRGLRALSNEPTVPAEVVPLGAVVARARRARTLRLTGIATGSAAAVVALALAVQAAPFRDTATPPAGPTPTATAAPTTTPTTTPTPTPTPTPTSEPPVVAARPLVGLTWDGRLLLRLLDPGTGEVRSEVAPDIGLPAGRTLAVTPDGTAAFVTAAPVDRGWDSLLYRVSLADGSAQQVADGWDPAVSPDGRTLAFVGPQPGDESETLFAVHLLDLATGAVRYLTGEQYCGCELLPGEPTWSPDGRQLAVGLGYPDSEYSVDLAVVDVTGAGAAGPPQLLDAPAAGPDGRARYRASPAYLPDGRLATLLMTDEPAVDGLGEDVPVPVGVELLDPDSGAVTGTVALPELERTARVGLSTVGDRVVLVVHDVGDDGAAYAPQGTYVQDGAGGFRLVGTGFEAAAG